MSTTLSFEDSNEEDRASSYWLANDSNTEIKPRNYGKKVTMTDSVVVKRCPRTPNVENTVSYNKSVLEKIIQHWSGTVIESNGDEITVKLEDLINPGNPDEIVTLSIDEIEERDLEFVSSGAMFNWYIGYKAGPKHRKERFSKIVFRRLLNWTNNEVNAAKKLAEDYSNFFQGN